jgi:putative ABC transport system substrate-binding protein
MFERKRREFITLLGGAAAWPLAARALPSDQVRRIGVLMMTGNPLDDPESRARIAALMQGLEKLGWVEGRNVQLDYRWARGDADKAQLFAKELIPLQPDVIVAHTTTACIALKRVTTTIPIVFVNVVDPIGSGLIANLARPGGNFTGLIHFEPGMAGKWLGMFKEVAPSVARVAILYSPETLPSHSVYEDAVREVAPSFAITPFAAPASNPTEIQPRNRYSQQLIRRWLDRVAGRHAAHAPRPDHCLYSSQSRARSLPDRLVSSGRRFDVIRGGYRGPLPTSRILR